MCLSMSHAPHICSFPHPICVTSLVLREDRCRLSGASERECPSPPTVVVLSVCGVPVPFRRRYAAAFPPAAGGGGGSGGSFGGSHEGWPLLVVALGEACGVGSGVIRAPATVTDTAPPVAVRILALRAMDAM